MLALAASEGRVPFLNLNKVLILNILFVKYIQNYINALCIAFTRSSRCNKYLLKLGLQRVDSGAYPRGGTLTLEA